MINHPEKIAHYQILELLGEGGMGSVFKAIDTQRNETVAIKILSRHSLQSEEIRRRFRREASAGMRLDHPNIVKILEVGESENELFICMEYVAGKTLREIVQEKTPDLMKTIDIGIAAANALKHAHDQGIIHRDIKSANIMLAHDASVKIMDFGLARMQDASMLTREGEIIGTIAYMSPQQAVGEAIDHRSDIFSLGVVLYELLTGQLPFSGDYEMALIYSILNEEPISIREVNKSVPQALEQIIFKALKKDPQKRYQSANDLAADLVKIKDHLEINELIDESDLDLLAKTEVLRPEERAFDSRLIGRGEQLEALKSILRQVMLGEGHSVFITGEAGIGKTRLAWELEKHARTLKVRTIKCRCMFRQGVYPYQPFVEAIRDHFDIKGVKSNEKLHDFISNQAEGLLTALPVIRKFLNLDQEQKIIVESKEQYWDAIYKLILNIAQERPLILIIDDLHWADEDTLKLFFYIARNSRSARIMMIGTYRPEDVLEIFDDKTPTLIEMQHEMSREGFLSLIELKRISDSEVRELADSLFENADFDYSFYLILNRETEGNPFFVIELLKMLNSEGIILKKGQEHVLKENFQQFQIPGKVQDIVMRRVERLNKEEREILEIAAVEGEVFHSDTIAACLTLNRVKVMKFLQALEREHHIIHPHEKMYRFDHGKIRDILYDSITPELCSEYHLLIGNFLESEYGADIRMIPNIAHHFVEAGENKRALPHLIRAGEQARSVFANEHAIRFFEKAEAILNDLVNELENEEIRQKREAIYEGLGDVLALTGKHDLANAYYHQVNSLLQANSPKQAVLLWKMGSVHIHQGENEKTLQFLNQAETICQKSLERLKLGIPLEAFSDANITEQDLFTLLGKIMTSRARILKISGKYREAIEEIEKGLQFLSDKGNLTEKSQAYNDFGNILFDQGNYENAAEMYSKSMEMREKIADKKGLAETRNNLALIFIEKGQYEKAAELLEESIEQMNQIGFRVGIAGTYNNLGAVYQDLGRLENAYKVHQKSLKICEATHDIPGEILSYANIGSVNVELGNGQTAVKSLEKSIALMDARKIMVLKPQALYWLSRAFLSLGNIQSAQDTAEKAHQEALRLNQRVSQGFTNRILGMIGLERLTQMLHKTDLSNFKEEIHKYFSESLEIFESLKMEHEFARTCLEIAKFFKWTKESNQYDRYFHIAKEIFERLGATHDLKKIEEINS